MSGLRNYARFIAWRLGFMALTLLGLATIVFLMIKAIPGDEAQVAAGEDASPAQVAAVRLRLGLDAPVIVQYGGFLGRLLHGDLGTSITTMQPVLADLARVLPSTIELVVVAMIMNLAVAIPAATLAAGTRGSAYDGASRILAIVAGGLPVFWLALVLQYLTGSVWRILPISGQNSFGMAAPRRLGMPVVDALLAGSPASFVDSLRHILLPAAVLALLFSTQIFRTLRASLLGILASDFMMPVRAKGASRTRLLLGHALPNALGPAVTLAGTQAGIMVGSAVLVETVFARQGVGGYLSNAVIQKDTYAVLGAVLFVGAVVCVVNLLVDILQIVIDPQVRSTQFGSRQS